MKHEDCSSEVSGVVKTLQSLQPDMLIGMEDVETNFKDGVLTVKASKRHTVANVIECIEMLTEKLEKANGMLEWTHKEVLRLNIENSELGAKLSMAERERDAAVIDLSDSCKFCNFAKQGLEKPPCDKCFQRVGKYPWSPMVRTRFEWRGVCDENTKEE